jgi:hypothetical protein
MTDREKAFAINGLRNYLRGEFKNVGVDPGQADTRLAYVAKRMLIEPALLEQIRREHQEFLEEVISISSQGFRDGK